MSKKLPLFEEKSCSETMSGSKVREPTKSVHEAARCVWGGAGRAQEWFRAADPKIFGIRDGFHGRQFFNGLGREGGGNSNTYIYCILYFYYYYISSTSDHQALDPEAGDPCFRALVFKLQCASHHSLIGKLLGPPSRVSDSVGLGRGVRICLSNKFPDDVEAADLGDCTQNLTGLGVSARKGGQAIEALACRPMSPKSGHERLEMIRHSFCKYYLGGKWRMD